MLTGTPEPLVSVITTGRQPFAVRLRVLESTRRADYKKHTVDYEG